MSGDELADALEESQDEEVQEVEQKVKKVEQDLGTQIDELDDESRSTEEDLNARIDALEVELSSLRAALETPLEDDSVESRHIVDLSIEADDLARDAVLTTKIASGAVTTSDLADEAVTGEKIDNGAVTSGKISDGTITSSDLASSSVTTSQILDGTITSLDLGTDSVGPTQIAADSVDSDELSDTISLGSSTAAGALWVYSGLGSNFGIRLSSSTLGFVGTYYTGSGNPAAMLTSSSSSGLASMGVNNDDSSCCAAGAYIDSSGNGVIYGDVATAAIKNFVVEHPADPDLRIVYASLEGPEAGAYIRGVADLEDGIAVVELPEHFRLIAAEEGITATITPTSPSSRGLAVVELTPEYLVIEELDGGTGSYPVYWRVEAMRLGYEDYRPVRPASEYDRTAAVPARDR